MVDLSAFERHQRIAFQLSGGRDSVSALHVVRDFWPRLRVYFMDTGDAFTETHGVVAEVARRFNLNIEIVRADVAAYWDAVGWPSDVVPVSATPIGRTVDAEPVRVVGRFDCCYQNLMRPMHERMLDDGITLIVRGQRDEDYLKPPMRSGDVRDGIEVLYPIEDWTTDQVDSYTREHDLPVAPWYVVGQQHGSDCLRCTAWWDDGRMPWLRRHHPQAHAEVLRRLEQIMGAVKRQTDQLLENDHG
jgi:phosphoadenosine phosphosulfate reductase